MDLFCLFIGSLVYFTHVFLSFEFLLVGLHLADGGLFHIFLLLLTVLIVVFLIKLFAED
jgi:hypothetical protein